MQKTGEKGGEEWRVLVLWIPDEIGRNSDYSFCHYSLFWSFSNASQLWFDSICLLYSKFRFQIHTSNFGIEFISFCLQFSLI
jgi:hypothetical protein